MVRENQSYQFMPGEADRYLTWLYNRSTLGRFTEPMPRVTKDPKDDHIIALAVHEKVDVIVSNDDHVLELKEVSLKQRAIPIVTARQFLAWLEHSGYSPDEKK
jgi:predicted nucleic acid-binding protein